MPRWHAVQALVVAVCCAVNFVVIEIGLHSFPPLLFGALRFGLIDNRRPAHVRPRHEEVLTELISASDTDSISIVINNPETIRDNERRQT